MQIKLHIGHYKTGTTAFQSLLASQRDRLWEVGKLYPMGHKPLYHQHGQGFVQYVRDEPDYDIFSDLERWESISPKVLILSAEGLSNPRSGGGKALIQTLKQYGTVEVIYMIRHWSTYLPSRFAQNTKTGDQWCWTEYIKACASTAPHHKDFDFASVIEEYLSGKPDKFTLLPYDRDGAIANMLAACDLDPTLSQKPGDDAAYFGDNNSDSEIAIETMRLMNCIKEPFGPSNIRFKTLQENVRLPRRLNNKKLARLFVRQTENYDKIYNIIQKHPALTPATELNFAVDLWTERLKQTCKHSNLEFPFEVVSHKAFTREAIGSNLGFHDIPDNIRDALKGSMSKL